MIKKKILITSGDPAGCGPLICLKAIEELRASPIDFFLVGDKKIYKKIPLFKKIKPKINFIDLNTPGVEKVRFGSQSPISGLASLAYIKEGLRMMQKYGINRLVTAPVSKEAIKEVNPSFSGHTEYLARYFKIKNFEMMFVSKEIKAVIITRHVPLRKVSKMIRVDKILETISLVYASLKNQFRINKPKIAFSAFNPHAGIDTFLEREEEVILKAIAKFPKKIYGPYPSDTLFLNKNSRKYDCVISLYHDQAMIPFKLLFWQTGVNITLGLPIIRTSPIHGVAYSAFKHKEKISHTSMLAAIRLASKLSL